MFRIGGSEFGDGVIGYLIAGLQSHLGTDSKTIFLKRFELVFVEPDVIRFAEDGCGNIQRIAFEDLKPPCQDVEGSILNQPINFWITKIRNRFVFARYYSVGVGRIFGN